MERYQLGRVYQTLRAAMAAGDLPRSAQSLGQALGLPLQPAEIASHLAQAQEHLRPQLTYRGWKPAELAMMTHGIKPLVKFEDIPLGQARQAIWPKGVQVRAGSAYRRDDLLLRSVPCHPDHPDALICLYASRDGSGDALRELERSRREDMLGAAKLLSIPSCCAEAFAATFAHARGDQDDLNDAAARRLLQSGRSGRGEVANALINPLSDRELLGFYPCKLDCPAALTRAQQVQQVLPAAQSDLHELALPVLFWRLPFFVILEPLTAARDLPPGRLTWQRWWVNAFADKTARRAQLLLAAQWAAWSSGANSVQVEANRLTFLADEVSVREVQCDPSFPPIPVYWKG